MRADGRSPATIPTASLLLGAFLFVLPAFAQSDPVDIQKLLDRIDRLERRLADQEACNARLEGQVRAMREGGTGPTEPSQAASAPRVAQMPQTARAPQVEKAPRGVTAPVPIKPEMAKPPFDIYGYIKLDSSYDSGQVYPGNYAMWVQPPLPCREDGQQFDITANATRLGVNFGAPGFGSAVTSGKVEVDFYGGGAENKPNLMMRHAFFQVDWPAAGVTLLAGQSWDVISPLFIPTVNYSVGWYAGNIGYRHPQLRLSKEFRRDGSGSLLLQGALVRTMGHFAGERNTGVDAGFPTAQARLAYSFPSGTGGSAALGLSGHWGEECYPSAEPGQPDSRVRSWSANLDMKIPMGRRVTLLGEAFTGRDLDSYLGGSGESVRLDTKTATGSTGGWLALSIKGSEKVIWNFGASVDDPRNSELSSGSRCRNASIFGNGYFSVAPSAQVQAELSYWTTDYLGKPGVRAFRAQLSFQYTF